MTKWEYRSISIKHTVHMVGSSLDTAAFDDMMNQLGQESWELVTIFHHTSRGNSQEVIATFKRPIGE